MAYINTRPVTSSSSLKKICKSLNEVVVFTDKYDVWGNHLGFIFVS